MLRIQDFTFNFFQEHSYVVWDDSGGCVIIDPGCESSEEKEELWDFIAGEGLKPAMVLLTHAHLDHIFGVKDTLERYGIKAMMDPSEAEIVDKFNGIYERFGLRKPDSFPFEPLSDGQTVPFGNTDIKVISTPGHSPGGVCFHIEKEKVIFTGDTLFAGSIGRTDNAFASLESLMASLRDKLMLLDGDTDVLPGHGPGTSIARERTTNPFIFEDTSGFAEFEQ